MTRLVLILTLLIFGCENTKLTPTVCSDPCYSGPENTSDMGECRTGKPICEEGRFIACEGEILPQLEICDGRDNNCNGRTDEYVTDPEFRGPCGSNVGECSKGITLCDQGKLVCRLSVEPTEEVCDGKDNDCNGFTDDIEIDFTESCYDGPPESLLYSPCHAGVVVCLNGVDTCYNQKVPSAELCDSVDNDCNGIVDDGLEINDVDVVIHIDLSGSMQDNIAAIAYALNELFNELNGIEEYKFALIYFPVEASDGSQIAFVAKDFTTVDEIINEISTVQTSGLGNEPSWDTIYDVATGETELSWREDSRKVQVIFTDEWGQSFKNPKLNEFQVATAAQLAGHKVFAFIELNHTSDFDDICYPTGGDIYNLNDPAFQFIARLQNILQSCN